MASKKIDNPELEVRENTDGTFVVVTLSADAETPAEVIHTSETYGTKKEAEAALKDANEGK